MEIRRVKKHDVDMTSGSVFRHLLNFAVPLLMGNIFQQLYNTVDTWVVGNYVSNEAFSAVGTVAPIINTLIGAFSGLASGAGVVISQYYGAGRHDRGKGRCAYRRHDDAGAVRSLHRHWHSHDA